MKRRDRVAIAVAVVAASVSVGGVIGATFIKSPAQLAAQATAPRRAVLTAVVRRSQLRQAVVLRGQFGTASDVTFTPSSAVAPSGVGPVGNDLVVTKIVAHTGQTIRAGNVVAEVSGRPVIVLPGAFHAFRDMVQGQAGPDIAQLQRALSALGWLPSGDDDGTFGTSTALAVRKLYRAAGYPVPLGSQVSLLVSPGSGKSKQASPSRPVEVPASEVMFVPALPAMLTGGPSHVGQDVHEPFLKVSPAGLVLTAQLGSWQARGVHLGSAVRVVSSITDSATAGRVTSIGALRVDAASATASRRVTIAPVRGSWASQWAGQNVQLTIVTKLTQNAVLTVPESALRSSAQHGAMVWVRSSASAVREVPVRVGVSSGGLVAVSPIGHARLDVGDDVEVGRVQEPGG